jgi:hypothetical protein
VTTRCRLKLKRHLLVRRQTVEQRDCSEDCFKMEIADWVLQALEEAGQRLAVDVGLASERYRALDRLPVGQINISGNIIFLDRADTRLVTLTRLKNFFGLIAPHRT